METMNLIYLIVAAILFVLTICGVWAHYKVIDVEYEVKKLNEEGQKYGVYGYYIKVKVKRLGIFKNHQTTHTAFRKGKYSKRDFIKQYTRKV